MPSAVISECLKNIKFLTNTAVLDTATLLPKLEDKTENIIEVEKFTKAIRYPVGIINVKPDLILL